MQALMWHSKSSVRVLHIKYSFLISLRFYFYDKRTCIGLFKAIPYKIISGSIRDNSLVELGNKVY